MPRPIDPQLCVRCKGYKRLCGLPRCPILDSFQARVETVSRLQGDSVEGSSPPSVIVGEAGYPSVPVLYAVPPGVRGDEARGYGDVKLWFSRRIPLQSIIRLRASMIYLSLRARIDKPEQLYEREISLAAVSLRPVDTEAVIEKRPIVRLRFDELLEPTGPTARARLVRVTGSPRLSRKLERLIWDDADAETAVLELYRAEGDVYTAMAALSMGLLGRRARRRLVPTRWAITAVDSMVGDHLAREVKMYEREPGEVLVAHYEYLGNRFTILVAPGPYEAEMIEVWQPRSLWAGGATTPVVHVVRENATGRLSEMDGGFMAARLAVLEWMVRSRVRGSVVILREITHEYYAPVGNWHIRESVRKAMEGVQRVPELQEALKLLPRLHPGLARHLASILSRSRLLRKLSSQRRLTEYFTPSQRA